LQAVLSWVNPSAPIAPLLARLTDPLLDPIRQRLPRLGGVDLSPLVLILLAQVLLSLTRDLNPLL
jgi:YggT family protein